MSETKWTPGPWVVVSHGSIAEYLGPRVCRNGNISADIKLCGNRWVEGAWKDDAEAHANMHLIAAAPDLYAALGKCDALIKSAQAVLAEHLPPDGMSAAEAINMLLGILDGPDQREAQSAADSALRKARGGT